MGMSKVKVLFVCLGNICRSPLAEGVFRTKVRERGLDDHFEIDSCGTSNYHIGEQPDKRTIKNALKNGVKLNHRGRQFTVQDYYDFDYIITMDSSNRRDVERLRPIGNNKQIRLMRSFDKTGVDKNVPDPYYGGENGFQEVFDIIDRSAVELMEFIVKESEL